PAPPAAREEVDGRCEIRQEHPDEHELDRPAAHDPAAEVDVARRPGREGDPLLQRVEDVLGGATDLQEAADVERRGDIGAAASRPVAAGRDRDRGHAAADERRLLVAAVREAEIDELAERARPRRIGAGLRGELRPHGLREPGVGERGVSPPSSSRGRPAPAIASRSSTAITCGASGACAANHAAPMPPWTAPSVERKSSVYGSRARAALPDGAYARASSRSAAVPDALSFAPGPLPSLSRWAMTTIVFCERPAFEASTLTKRTRPREGTSAVNVSRWTTKPYGASCAPSQRTALAAPGVPATRSGAVALRSAASARAASGSKAGGRFGGGCSAAGRATLK